MADGGAAFDAYLMALAASCAADPDNLAKVLEFRRALRAGRRYGGAASVPVPQSEGEFPAQPMGVLPMSVDIILPVHNALEDVQACLESVRRTADRNLRHVWLVDDGSALETAQWLASQQDGLVRAIRTPGNLGFTRAVALGFQQTSAELVVVLNSDAVVDDGWLKALIRPFQEDARVALTGALSNAAAWQSLGRVTNSEGLFATNLTQPGAELGEINRFLCRHGTGGFLDLPIVHGFCFAISRAAYDQVGGFDLQTFGAGYGETQDLCFRLRAAGYRIGVCTDVFVQHGRSRSYSDVRRTTLSNAARRNLYRKHGALNYLKAEADCIDNAQLTQIRAETAGWFAQDTLWIQALAEEAPRPAEFHEIAVRQKNRRNGRRFGTSLIGLPRSGSAEVTCLSWRETELSSDATQCHQPSGGVGKDAADLFGQVFADATGARSQHFAPLSARRSKHDYTLPKIVAFYLPQFHPIPENDQWWGKGFTEWTNVTKAVPQFAGHYQPRLPGELGFYDLRMPEVMERQIALARQYGLGAFCFHYYWFAGHRLLEAPVDSFLSREDEAFNFPFCLCWANENWTRRWDGAEEDLLMRQTHSSDDHAAVFEDLLRYINDPRYIKINNRPLIVVYRPAIIQDVREMARIWRRRAREAGYEDIFLVATNAFGFEDPAGVGFDALCEFPPHGVGAHDVQETQQFYNPDFNGRVFSYDAVVSASLERLDQMTGAGVAERYFPTVMAGWDNEARRPGRGHVFHGADPEKFHRWLVGAAGFSQKNHADEARLVFVNAWNEWAEGTYLEPDRRFGYGYLNAIAELPETLSERQAVPLAVPEPAVRKARAAILIHAFYFDLVEYIAAYLNQAHLNGRFDVLLTVPPHWSAEQVAAAREMLVAHAVWVTPNAGRDIYPFQIALQYALAAGYDWALKIHTKKSPHLPRGAHWRQSMLEALLSPEAVDRAHTAFATRPDLGMLVPEFLFMPFNGATLHNNRDNVNKLTLRYNVDAKACDRFVAGSMFWFRPSSFARLVAAPLPLADFGPELGAIDGTVAHAFERLFATLVASAGFTVETYDTPDAFNPYL